MILAGGAEALSHAPLVLRKSAVEWFGQMAQAKGPAAQAKAMAGLRPKFFKPIIGLERGLTDPITALNMGQTAELLAHHFNIDREAADTYAMQSHHRLARAQQEGWLDDEVMPAFDRDGVAYDRDNGVRPDSDLAGLAKPKPAFEKPYGKVTAGNASQISDGASWVIVASEDAVEKHGLTPIARIMDSAWSALDPSVMGLGPVLASTALTKRHNLDVADIDLWELNEAFAAQVLSCIAAWDDTDFCRAVLGLETAFGRIERDQLNIDGGAISLGHPVGTSGNRIVLHLANALKRLGKKRGIATECIGGGLGGAMMLEAV